MGGGPPKLFELTDLEERVLGIVRADSRMATQGGADPVIVVVADEESQEVDEDEDDDEEVEVRPTLAPEAAVAWVLVTHPVEVVEGEEEEEGFDTLPEVTTSSSGSTCRGFPATEIAGLSGVQQCTPSV